MGPRPLLLLPFAFLFLLIQAGCGEDRPNRSDDPRTAPTTPSIAAQDTMRLLGAWDPGFVGDASCAPCHAEVAARYRETNHGRSLTAFDPRGAPERLETPSPASGDPWTQGWVHSPSDGLRYRASVDGEDLVQHEALPGEDGGAATRDVAHAADQVIGSGNQTRSYLMIRNGRVTQMPLTWYAQQGRWDLSPGYAEANDRFSRPIILQCLACHGDLPRLEPHTQNAYGELPGPISCERCHGPGAEHVERRVAGEDPGSGPGDPWIVNPSALGRSAELAVCAQCHLAGVIAYPEGEDPLTFRPGMELAENRGVHVPALQLEDPDWVGIDSHPIRLARSACFQASEMTCTTCHLAHLAGEQVPADHYRNRCVDCHGGAGPPAGGPGTESLDDSPDPPEGILCSRPGPTSPEEARSGDCVGCHLTAGGTSDVPHVRFTDHWIQRVPRPPLPPEAGRPVIESPTPVALVEVSAMGTLARPELLLHRSDALKASLRTEALFHFYETMHRHTGYLPEVVTSGREAEGGALGSGEGTFTVEGRLALARALLELDSVDAAEGVLRDATAAYPDHPWGHFLLGALTDERRRRPAEALPHLDRALALQPRLNEARVKRAEVLYALGRRGEAVQELEAVVEEEPLHRPRSWFNLGILRAEGGDARGAEAAFQEAAATDPLNPEAAIQLGTLQLQRGAPGLAEASFRQAVAAAPEHPGAHGSLALALLEQGRTQEGRARLQRVLELDPDNQAARDLLSRLDG